VPLVDSHVADVAVPRYVGPVNPRCWLRLAQVGSNNVDVTAPKPRPVAWKVLAFRFYGTGVSRVLAPGYR
jgi:hypothetical protein